jgi:hypothetical protein
MRAAGKIADPHTWAMLPFPDKLKMSSKFLMYTRRTAETSNTQNVIRTQLPKKYMKGEFNHSLFLTSSGDDLKSVLSAVSTGSVAALDKRVGPMLTEPVRQCIVRGMEESRAESGGAAQGVEVIQSLESSYVAGRLIYPAITAQSAPKMTQRPTHAQICAQYKLLVRPIAVLPEGSSPSFSSSSPSQSTPGGSARSKISSLLGGGPSAGKRSAQPLSPMAKPSLVAEATGPADETSDAARLRAKREEEWESVLDEKTGLVYWFLTNSHAIGYKPEDFPSGGLENVHRTWAAPAAGQLIPKKSWRIEMSGIEREPVTVTVAGATGNTEDRLVKVTHLVTWEKAIPPLSQSSVMTASPATARWRIVKLQ